MLDTGLYKFIIIIIIIIIIFIIIIIIGKHWTILKMFKLPLLLLVLKTHFRLQYWHISVYSYVSYTVQKLP